MKRTGTHIVQVIATIGVAGDKYPFSRINSDVNKIMSTLNIFWNSLWTGKGFYSGGDATFTPTEVMRRKS